MATKKAKKKEVIDLSKEIIIKTDVIASDAKDFLDYGTTVASNRAIPDVHDGLKPIHRFILIALNDLKLDAKAKTVKSQKIEGNVMGDYSPHTGSYATIDYLTQDYVFQLPPVYGKGNFSTIDGSKAGAARYTEVRNTIYGDLFVNRLSDKLVPYTDNYSGTKRLPKILPVEFPALLINGVKTGIAVGFTSSIAPHNPVDAMKTVIAFAKNPTMQLSELIDILKGPDLPTGGVLIGDVEEYYRTGEGKLINQGTIIEDPSSNDTLIITEVPYEMGGVVDKYVNSVTKAISENQLPGIKKIEDYSSTDGLHVEVTLDKKMDHEKAKAMLFSKTKLQTTYALSWMAIDQKTPRKYNLLSYMKTYLAFQHTLIMKEFKYEIEKASKRLNIVTAILKVPDVLSDVINAAQKTSGKAELESVLRGESKVAGQSTTFNFNGEQAEAIAGMRIYQLNHIDADALKSEFKDLTNRKMWAERYVSEPELRAELIVSRHEKLMKTFIENGFDKRKTQLKDISALKEATYTAEKIEVPITVTIDKYNYIKTTDQLKNATMSEDMITRYDTTTDDIITIFTDKGNMYQLPTNKLKRLSTRDKSNGDTVYAIFEKQGLTPNENILAYSFRSVLERETTQIVFISKNGLAKRVNSAGSSLITKTLRSKVSAYKPKSDDELYDVFVMDRSEVESQDIIVFRDDKIKRLPLVDIKEQSSMAGAGAQTFKSKDNADIKLIKLFNHNAKHHVVLYNAQDIDVAIQPSVKITQAFKKIDYTISNESEIVDESTISESDSDEIVSE